MPDNPRRSDEEDEEDEEDTVPPFLLEVGSKWPAHDEHYLIRFKLTERALEEGFPTCDFEAYPIDGRTGSGYPLVYGGDYGTLSGTGNPCTFGVRVDPDPYGTFPCTRIKEVCFEHNHPLDLPPEIWAKCKELDQADFPKWFALVRDRAIAQLTHIRQALDFRLTSHDPLQEWELDKSLQEQEFIRQSWNLLPDPAVRDKLRQATERLLIESTNYPIVPAASVARTPRAARTSSATQSPRTASRGNAKGKKSALPEPTDTAMRNIPRRPASPAGSRQLRPKNRRSTAQPPAAASPPAAPRRHSPARRNLAQHSRAGIDLCEESDDDCKPAAGELAFSPRQPKPMSAVPPARPAAGPASASGGPPQVPQAAAPPVPPVPPPAAPARPVNRNSDSASLADFLSSLEPDRHFERYVSHFRRCNLDEPEQLVSFARGPIEELDALLAELGKDTDGIKGMLPLWQGVFRRLLLAAADTDRET